MALPEQPLTAFWASSRCSGRRELDKEVLNEVKVMLDE